MPRSKIEKATPAPSKRDTVYPWDELADTCRNNPDEWFRMPIGNRVYANFAKNGRYTAFSGDLDRWEFTTRTVKGQVYLHARYRKG